jgi:hypothetical protein
MSELQRRMDAQAAEQQAHLKWMRERNAAFQETSDGRVRDFVGMMREKSIGATALYRGASHLVTVGSFIKGYKKATVFSFEPLGAGWLVPGASIEYEWEPTNWLVLDENQRTPRVVRCTPPINELPPLYDKSPYGAPEPPIVTLRGKDFADALIPTPFAQDRQYGWLAQAAAGLIKDA